MSLNWTVMAYIGFGGSGGGGTTVIINENGLTPVQDVDFELEEVRGDVDLQITEFTIIYEASEQFTLFLDEVS